MTEYICAKCQRVINVPSNLFENVDTIPHPECDGYALEDKKNTDRSFTRIEFKRIDKDDLETTECTKSS